MTLDKAIERYTSNAEYERPHGNLQGCLDFRQLAEWLRDYKRLLEQEPKIGYWIEHPEIETSTPEYLMFYECSECGDKQCFCKLDIHKKRFCSNCGCRMIEPQESEE